ncbi:MAG: NAD(P)-binding protein [Cyanobacteria bacterium P01_D01_bin.105]
MWDVAVIGAGLSGITCARKLGSAGYSVCILDKSRGLGGRMATRRVTNTHMSNHHIRVDHGLRYWQPKSTGLQALTAELVGAGVLQPWTASEYEIHTRGVLTPVAPVSAPKYAAKMGMSAVAKYLLQRPGPDGLSVFEPAKNLLTSHRAMAISHRDGHWTIRCEMGEVVRAKRCAIAMPAQQAADLLTSCLDTSTDAESLAVDKRIAQLKAVSYFPCLTLMAGYSTSRCSEMGALDPKGWMLTDWAGTSTDWVGLDSSKRGDDAASAPVIVIHSKPKFAQRYLEARDLQPAASVLLHANARRLSADWIAQPEWFQIHRWRYARVQTPHPSAALAVTDTLACGGDWCVAPETNSDFANIDYAYLSGCALADRLLA